MPSGMRRENSGPSWPVAIWTAIVLGAVVSVTLFAGSVFDRRAVVYADAPRPPRPNPATLTLVRVFGCDVARIGARCAKDVEDQANDWLQKAQPGVRVLGQELSASKYYLFLSLMYDVPDWRANTPKTKQPAEATP